MRTSNYYIDPIKSCSLVLTLQNIHSSTFKTFIFHPEDGRLAQSLVKKGFEG
jgi:hypothetical protein